MSTDKGEFDQAKKAVELESRARQTRNPELELEEKQERRKRTAKKNVAAMRKEGRLPPSKQPTKAETSKAKKFIAITKKYKEKRPFLNIIKKIPGVKKVAGLAEAIIEYSANQPLAKTRDNYQMIARKADQVKIPPTEMRQALEKSRLKKEIGTYLQNKKEGKGALSKKQIAEIEDQLGKFPEKGETPGGRKLPHAGTQKRVSRLEKELTGMSPGTFGEVAKGKEAAKATASARSKGLTGKEGGYRLVGEKTRRIKGMTVKQKLARAEKLERAEELFSPGKRVSPSEPVFDKSEEFFDVGAGTGTSSAVRSGKKSGAQIANEAKMKSLRVALNRLQKAKKEGKDFATINGRKVSVNAIGVTRDSTIKKT